MPLTERDVNIPHKTRTQTPPAHKTPQPHSKLPRFVATPNSAPAASKWTPRTASPAESVERTGSALRHTAVNRNLGVATTTSGQKKLEAPAKDKPLPQEKALPPRPVARLSNALSPTKDGRCLIDACEQPLHITSVSGDRREWPALRPQLSRSPSVTPTGEHEESEKGLASSACSQSAAAASMMAAATELTNTIIGKETGEKRGSKRSSRSPASSYASATENSSQIAADASQVGHNTQGYRDHAVDQPYRTLSNASSHADLPARKASLRSRISNGSIITPSVGSRQQVMTLTDFTRVDSASPASTESRTHSPSPASFSRPRPGSVSTTATTPRSMKTASRIPIPDSKKATTVELKKDQPNPPTLQRSTAVPTFGSRRLASPEALEILENGKMRRQMQRAPTNASSNPRVQDLRQESDLTGTKTSTISHNVNSTTAVVPSTNSTIQDTFDANYPDDNETPTPSTRILQFPNSTYRNSRTIKAIPRSHERMDLDTFQNGGPWMASTPPQTSPFVAPLETIPSEAFLSVDANDLNDEGREELIKTLSHLEGKGSPPKFDVDNETLLHMFGHLKKGLERNPHNSAAFAQNAAAAEKFLAMRGSSILEVKGLGDERGSVHDSKKRNSQTLQDDSPTAAAGKKQTVISKWSASTPSDKALSPPSEEIGSALQYPTIPKARPKTPSLHDPVSIGYPSRIPSRVTNPVMPTSDGAAVVPSIPSRRSSPALGKRQPGSVRAAREALQVTNASFARTTASAESRKTTRPPNPSMRAFSIPDPSPRGRLTTIEKPRSTSDGVAASKAPRSRSKSRYVLDKINGLFSGKRDKKSIAIPPVPRIDENNISVAPTSPEDTPPARPVQMAQITKMPSLSPPEQTLPRSTSRTTMRTDDTTLIDRISMKDETQCVQVLSEHLVGKARSEVNPQRKERLLTFAKVLNDSLISIREAAISAETAQHAAKSAQVSYEMTQKSLAMVQRLAAAVVRTGSYNRR